LHKYDVAATLVVNDPSYLSTKLTELSKDQQHVFYPQVGLNRQNSASYELNNVDGYGII